MKLKDTYLCTDIQCDQVFYFDQLAISIYGHVPTCPICGNKNNLSLFKTLNRQEVKKNETNNVHHSNSNDDHGGGNAVKVNNSSGPSRPSVSDRIKDGKDGISNNTYIEHQFSIETDKCIAGVTYCFNALREWFRRKSGVFQRIQRFNANTLSRILSRC